MLREVCVADVASPLDTTCCRFLIPEEHFDQCRLAGTIWSDEADAVTAFNIQIEIFKQNLVIKAFAEVVQCQDIPADSTRTFFIHLGPHPTRVHNDTVDFVHTLNASLGDFTDFTRSVPTTRIALDQVFEAFDFLLLILPDVVLAIEALLFLLSELCVVTAVERKAAIVKVGNRVDNGIQERPVVADQNHGSGIFFEECLKPFHCLNIQVVCGFIQN